MERGREKAVLTQALELSVEEKCQAEQGDIFVHPEAVAFPHLPRGQSCSHGYL